MSTTQPKAAPAALLPAGWATLMITHDGQHAEEVAYGPQIMMDRLRKWLDRYFAMLTTPATVAGQCEDAIELLGKYKELCEEIKRGDSYHIGRIDAAISVLAQAAPQPAVQQGAPVAWRSWDSENSRWNFTLWPDEWAGHADVWEPLYTYPAAPVAQGDALTPAARDVLAERQRQISTEGWTSEHDDKEHLPGELALAAASYVCADEQDAPPASWPWDWSWWKPRDRRRNLVKSGALILAEIDRIDRAQAKEGV